MKDETVLGIVITLVVTMSVFCLGYGTGRDSILKLPNIQLCVGDKNVKP